jgi:hypothetical protein
MLEQSANKALARQGGRVFSDLHFSGGRYIAAQYGLFRAQVIGGPYAAGATTLIVFPGQVSLADGHTFEPFAANCTLNCGIGAQEEILTVTGVTYAQAPPGYGGPEMAAYLSVTATSFPHGSGDPVSSATVGLQEAINDATQHGGGIVTCDGEWFGEGGTLAIIAAATGFANTSIEDTTAGVFSVWTGVGAVANSHLP